MRRFHHSILSTCIFAVVWTALPPAVHSQSTTLWDHNNSTMALYADGASRVLRYHEPRAGMQQEGVRSGTLLFSGTKSGDTYSGTAYVFSRRCGAHPYQVTGTIAADERQITLYGTAPSGFDATCRPLAWRQDVLQFSLVQPIDPPTAVYAWSGEQSRAEQELYQQRLTQLRAEQARQTQELAEQQARAEHLRRQRQQDERHLAELRAFADLTSQCRAYVISSCDAALASPIANHTDRANLSAWRATAQQYQLDYAACRDGAAAACDAALASPAATDSDRPSLTQWRIEASFIHRTLAVTSELASRALTTAQALLTSLRELPPSTQITSLIATLLAATLLMVMVRSRNRSSPTRASADTPQSPTADWSPSTASAQAPSNARVSKQSSAGTAAAAAAAADTRSAAEPESAPPPPSRPAHKPAVVRDTPAALAAMELALAYIEEVRQADIPQLDDEAGRKHQLNTLSLAARKLQAAQRADADAILEGEGDDGTPYRFRLNELEAEALFLEGLTHQVYDTKRAIPALRKASQLNPHDPRPLYVLGLTHAANMNKAEAVAAFEAAVALAPRNISYRKELDRAQNLSHGEIVGYKATRAAETVYDAGIKTANAGIRVYNFGVICWNIFAVTWNVVTFPLRLVLKIALALR